MTDCEKVIKAVETCFDSWIDKHRNMGLDLQTVKQMKCDALELLKKGQEAVEPLAIRKDTVDEIYDWIAECPACGMTWAMWHADRMRFCPGCGKAVKWE